MAATKKEAPKIASVSPHTSPPIPRLKARLISDAAISKEFTPDGWQMQNWKTSIRNHDILIYNLYVCIYIYIYNTWCNWCASQIKMVKSNSWVKKTHPTVDDCHPKMSTSLIQFPNHPTFLIEHSPISEVPGSKASVVAFRYKVISPGNRGDWIQSNLPSKQKQPALQLFFWACQRTDTRWSDASPNRCHGLLLSVGGNGCRSQPWRVGTLDSPVL